MIKNSKLKAFFNKTSVKSFILTLFPILTSVFTSLLFYYVNKNEYKYVAIVASVFSVIAFFYILLLIHYAREEKTNKDLSEMLEKQNKTSEKAVISICALCRRTAESFNTFSHSIIEEKKIDLNIWCFDIMAMQICNAVYDIITEVSGTTEIDVTYTKLVEAAKSKIQTIGFRNKNLMKPNIYKRVRDFNDNEETLYFDAKIFKNNNPDIVVFDNCEEISKNFLIKNRANYNNKYTQYVAIPVICNDNRIIGVLQVASYNNGLIAKNKVEIYEIATKYLLQFVSLSLLFSKSEKEVMSIADLKIKKRSLDE